VMQWLRRDPARRAIAVVQVTALARHGGAPRGETRADVIVPKPFTPRQMVEAVRSAVGRQMARRHVVAMAVTGQRSDARAARLPATRATRR
jgi:hypothetical protein